MASRERRRTRDHRRPLPCLARRDRRARAGSAGAAARRASATARSRPCPGVLEKVRRRPRRAARHRRHREVRRRGQPVRRPQPRADRCSASGRSTPTCRSRRTSPACAGNQIPGVKLHSLFQGFAYDDPRVWEILEGFGSDIAVIAHVGAGGDGGQQRAGHPGHDPRHRAAVPRPEAGRLPLRRLPPARRGRGGPARRERLPGDLLAAHHGRARPGEGAVDHRPARRRPDRLRLGLADGRPGGRDRRHPRARLLRRDHRGHPRGQLRPADGHRRGRAGAGPDRGETRDRQRAGRAAWRRHLDHPQPARPAQRLRPGDGRGDRRWRSRAPPAAARW